MKNNSTDVRILTTFKPNKPKGNDMDTLLKITDTKELAGPELSQAIKTAPQGANLIYYRGAVGEYEKCLMDAAWEESYGLGELVARPTKNYNRKGYRIWDYIIQKHGGAA
jgi:hypothetical protein